MRRSTLTIIRLNHGTWPATREEWHDICQRAGAVLHVCPRQGDEYRGALIDDTILVQPGRTDEQTHARICHELVEHLAVADKLGLAVQYEERSSKLWKLVWELYCRSECMLRETNNAKLYESSTVSLSIRI